jgi:hypothetical protein
MAIQHMCYFFTKISQKMIGKKELSDLREFVVENTKVVQLIEIYNFYIGHFFILQSGNNIVHKCYTSLIWFYKLYVTYVSFVNNVY